MSCNGQCRSNDAPNGSREAGQNNDNSLILGIVFGLVGTALTGGIGTVGAQLAVASLRNATMTAAAGALGASSMGAGYLVVEGGKLVLRRSRPGIVATVRAANRVARDARRGCLEVYQQAEDGITMVQIGAQNLARDAGTTFHAHTRRLGEATSQDVDQAMRTLRTILDLLPMVGNPNEGVAQNSGSMTHTVPVPSEGVDTEDFVMIQLGDLSMYEEEQEEDVGETPATLLDRNPNSADANPADDFISVDLGGSEESSGQERDSFETTRIQLEA